MDKNRKKQIKKIILWVTLVAVVIALAVMPLIAKQKQPEDGPVASILTAQAALRDMETAIMGGGTLISETAEKVTVPTTVKLTEYLVSNGDIVTKGEPIAKVDQVSVMDAIAQVQEALTELASEIESERLETADTVVKSHATGTVKQIFAEKGDDVQDVMLEYGCLAVLSLDDMMAVEIKCSCSLASGDRVTVTLSDGKEVEGKVESNLNGSLIVTVEDNNYPVDESVAVSDEDGTPIGSGKLYIHSPWKAAAYSGTVSGVRTAVDRYVYDGAYLFTLEDTGSTSLYHKLVAQRAEYEELMQDLFKMYEKEMLTAPCDGIVTGVDKNGIFMLSDQQKNVDARLLRGTQTEEGIYLSLLSSTDESKPDPEPDPVTPATYTGWVCQVFQKGVDGLILRMNGTTFTSISLDALPAEMLNVGAMTISANYPSADIYPMVYVPEQGLIPGAAVNAGDILFFAVDEENTPYIILIGHSDVSSGGSGGNTQQPGTSGGQTGTGTGGLGGLGGMSGMSGMSGMAAGAAGMGAGGYGGMGAGGAEEEDPYYSLDTYTIASVTPQTEMTAEITVDELDIFKVYLGQTVDVTVNALPGENYTAVVTGIGNDGTNEGGNTKYTVEITMTMEGDMIPGMTISVCFPLQSETNILAVPVEALYDQKGTAVLYTSYNPETEKLENPVTVETGFSDGSYVQILSGIEEGQVFYYEYYDTVEFSNIPKTEFTF